MEKKISSRRLIAMAASVWMLAAAPWAEASFTNTFYSTNLFASIPFNGPASVYPWIIPVAGVPGSIEKVVFSVQGIEHSSFGDIGMLLRSPKGDESLLFSAAAGGFPTTNGVSVTIDADAPAKLPVSGDAASGTYKPSNYFPPDLNEPRSWVFDPLDYGNLSNYNEDLSVFNGSQANGEWSLLVFDAIDDNQGKITNGWSITFVTSSSNQPPVFAVVSNQLVIESNTLSFAVSASDPVDFDVISLSYEAIPLGAAFTDNGGGTGSLVWSNAGPVGVYTSRFVATDKDGAVTQSVLITVQAANDGDDIDDGWETFYFGNLGTANNGTDFDGDLFIDLHEFLAGTVPTNAGSYLRASGVSAVGSNVVIQWPGVTGRVYGVGMRTNLLAGGFTLIATNIPGLSPVTAVTASPPVPGSLMFFRIQLESPVIP